uniref:AlNc14C4G634 protein n=1 Tax=Albugo laibachii Nc14 TaxID=890382 RepID=F0W0J2_9STRA|nr:AlNc14C4G634 [Albugo laibachii Nc14]|eukprot:CCA14564.1 AlNc14C4G634 [Albugo laibachii Nc14]
MFSRLFMSGSSGFQVWQSASIVSVLPVIACTTHDTQLKRLHFPFRLQHLLLAITEDLRRLRDKCICLLTITQIPETRIAKQSQFNYIRSRKAVAHLSF